MYDFEWFTSILPKTACSSAVFIFKVFFDAYCIWCPCLCRIVYDRWISDIND